MVRVANYVRAFVDPFFCCLIMGLDSSSFEPIICPTCHGDASLRLQCEMCAGRSLGWDTGHGFLTWRVPLSATVFEKRQRFHQFNQLIHICLGLLTLGLFGWVVSQILLVRTLELTPFFRIDRPFVIPAAWFGLAAAFFWFRVRAYQERHAEWTTFSRAPSLDVAAYAQSGVWSVLKEGEILAAKLVRSVEPLHLFVAGLVSGKGAIFLTRLGVSFEQVRDQLIPLLQQGEPTEQRLFSEASHRVLLAAFQHACLQQERSSFGVIQLLQQAFLADPAIAHALEPMGITQKEVTTVMTWLEIQERLKQEHDAFVQRAALKPANDLNRTMTARATELLNQVSEDMTQNAKAGRIAPAIPPEKALAELFRVIESGASSIVVIGEPGVGKTTLIEQLACRMVEERVPERLFDKRLVSIHVPELITGADAGMISERLLRVLEEVAMSGNIVLVLEGIEALAESGYGGTRDLIELLTSEIERLDLLVLSTTTPTAWTSYIERRGLASHSTSVLLEAPSDEEVLHILMADSGFIEYKNKVFFSCGALTTAVSLSRRFLKQAQPPESTLQLIRETATMVRQQKGERALVLAEDLAEIIHKKTGVPVTAITQDETDRLLNLEANLQARVIGQPEAVKMVAEAMRRARADVRDGHRPMATFLFLGPTGVGKTELAKALAAEYFGAESAMVRLDMSEYQDVSSAMRLIGLPRDPRGGLLTEAIRQKPYGLILLDELEKAHPDVLTLFLQVFDDGRLTDGLGRTIDFTNTVIIATSNAGSDLIQQSVKAQEPIERLKTRLLDGGLREVFRPEFLNRFDGTMIFRPLTLESVTRIAWLLIHQVEKRLLEKGFAFQAEDEAVEALAKAGYDPLFGARPLRRVIQERVETAIADVLLRKQAKTGDQLELTADGQIVVHPRS